MKKCAILLIGLLLSCSTPVAEPPRTITHHGCWYTVHKLTSSIQYGSRVIDVYNDVWEARCEEDYLERIQRAQCKILAVDPRTVIVSDCQEFIGLVNPTN